MGARLHDLPSMNVAAALFDHDLRILGACGKRLIPADLAPELLVGRTIFDLLSREPTATAETLHRQALEGIESTTDIRLAGRTFEQRLAPVRDTYGEIVAGISRVREVTEIRGLDPEMKESERRLRTAFEHGSVGKAIIGLEGRYEDVNPAMCAITGYCAAQLQQFGEAETTHPDDLGADLAAMA
jgi:PAS domain-containing protein